MIALLRVGNRTAGQKSASQKGQPAAVFLQHGKIDVIGHRSGTIHAVYLTNGIDLFPPGKGKGALARTARLGHPVKLQLERLFKQLRHTGNQCVALRHHPNFIGGKLIAEHQHTVGLRLRAAFSVQPGTAKFLFCLTCKGHAITCSSLIYDFSHWP